MQILRTPLEPSSKVRIKTGHGDEEELEEDEEDEEDAEDEEEEMVLAIEMVKGTGTSLNIVNRVVAKMVP